MNNNNINNDINKFDGKYLKCIVSKYNAVTDYLSNSGAMIVLQPLGDKSKYNGKEYNRNYVYLGNEFLASGYGFLCKDMRDDAENIVKVYNKTIQRLDKADEDEVLARKQADENIVNEFKNYVAKNGGPIENTTVTINNVKIPTKDIILYGEEAKYDNLEVVEYSANINGISTYYDNNTLLCPIGSTINNISIYITTKDNDSGGIDFIKVLHNISLDSTFTNGTTEVNEDIEAVIVNYNCDYDYNIEDDVSPKYNLHKWYYSNKLNSDLFINGYKKDVIKGIYLYVKETPKSAYKFYPRLLEHDYKIISAGNIIKSNKIELNNSLNVRPQYYMKWSYDDNINNDTKTFALNSFKDYDTTEIIFPVDNVNNAFNIYIAIPKNFRIQKIYLLENDLNKYNITGAVKKSGRSYYLPCPYSISNDDNKYCINYDIYNIKADNGIKSNMKLCINIVYNYRKLDNDEEYENNRPIYPNEELITTFDSTMFTTYINDEDFNNLYWISNSSMNTLQELLNLFNENGVNKTNNA